MTVTVDTDSDDTGPRLTVLGRRLGHAVSSGKGYV